MKRMYEVEVAYLLKVCVSVDAGDAVEAKKIAVDIAEDSVGFEYGQNVDSVALCRPVFVSATPVEDIEKYD